MTECKREKGDACHFGDILTEAMKAIFMIGDIADDDDLSDAEKLEQIRAICAPADDAVDEPSGIVEALGFDPNDVSAPRHLDGSPVDKEEAARVHAALASGEMKIEVLPEAAAELEKMGITEDNMRKALMASTKKTMS